MFFIAFVKNSFGDLFTALLTYFSQDSIGKIPLFNYNIETILEDAMHVNAGLDKLVRFSERL